jgi:hypothetical protein
MKKTVTREEVEKALFNEFKGDYHKSCVKILNELFGEPYEPKVGDWVVIGEDNDFSVNKSGDIGIVTHTYETYCRVDCSRNSSANNHNPENLRPATEEEIKRAQWKEGEVYEVWPDGEWRRYLRFSSVDYGTFWADSSKAEFKWDNFKRVVQC